MLKDGGEQVNTIRDGLLARQIPMACREVVEGYIQRANDSVVDLPAASALHGLSAC